MVAPTDGDAADAELADDADPDDFERAVHDVYRDVRDGPADGDCALSGLACPRGDVDGCLGGPVEIVQRHRLRHALEEALREIHGQGLAAAQDAAHRRAARERAALEEHGEHGRGKVQSRHVRVAHQAGEVLHIAVAVGPCKHQARSVDERPEELPDGDAEAERSLLQHDVVAGEAVRAVHPHDAVVDCLVRVHRALGSTRRARREDHVREALRERATDDGRGAVLGPFISVEQNSGGEEPRVALLGDDERDARVRHHEVEQLGRVAGVEGDVRAAGLQDREERDHHLEGALGADTDEHVPANATRA